MAEHWQIFGALAALVAAWSLVILGVMRRIMSQCTEDLERKINALSDISKDQQRIERAIMELKADLPVQYVRREDHIRSEVVISTKMDRVIDKVDRLQQTVMDIVNERK
jgi:phage host-nuclease inhibitor protein Gam